VMSASENPFSKENYYGDDGGQPVSVAAALTADDLVRCGPRVSTRA
jgi:hypothetical protein